MRPQPLHVHQTRLARNDADDRVPGGHCLLPPERQIQIRREQGGEVPKGRQSGASLLCLQHDSGKQKEQALRIQRVEHLFWAPEESPPISFPLVTSGPGASQGPAVPGS